MSQISSVSNVLLYLIQSSVNLIDLSQPFTLHGPTAPCHVTAVTPPHPRLFLLVAQKEASPKTLQTTLTMPTQTISILCLLTKTSLLYLVHLKKTHPVGDDVHSHVTINRGVSLRKTQGVSTLGQLTPESLDNFVNDAHAELFFNLVPSLLSLHQCEDVVQGRLSR